MNHLTDLHMATSTHTRAKIQARGFTMLEVLVAIIVVSIGLLGLGGMVGVSLKTSGSAYYRSRATALAYDMLDRLRANRGSSSVADTTLAGVYDNWCLCPAGSSCLATGGSCTTTTTGVIAQLDLTDWALTLSESELPDWEGGIVRTVNIVTIYVQWDDARGKGQRLETGTKASCITTAPAINNAIEQVCITTQL